MRTALIFGISGQDGAYLSHFLLLKGYRIIGVTRNKKSWKGIGNLTRIGIEEKINTIELPFLNINDISNIISEYKPDEIYNLSGISSVGNSFNYPLETIGSIVSSTIMILEAIRSQERTVKFYNAGSGEIYGNIGTGRADIRCRYDPKSPYGIAKMSSLKIVEHYRDLYGIFACTGILFNHESPLRGGEFVTKKIVNAAKEIAAGNRFNLKLGNINIFRDWGWAPEYVEAMWLMLQVESPRDYIIATGVTHSLEEYLSYVFEYFKLDWRDYTIIDNNLIRPSDIFRSVGNPLEAAIFLKWKAETKFEYIVENMCKCDY